MTERDKILPAIDSLEAQFGAGLRVELLQVPDLDKASRSLIENDRNPWEIIYLNDKRQLEVKYLLVEGIVRLEDDDEIERLVYLGSEFPGGNPMAVKLEFNVPQEDETSRTIATFFGAV